MQRIIFLTVGRIKTSWIAEGVEHYIHRVAPHIRLEQMVVTASSQTDPQKYREEESIRLLEKLQKMEGELFLLDEEGLQMTSVEFAKTVERAKDNGTTVIFVIGGAYGVTPELKKKAHRTFALSRMTFPHEFCQLVFLEQLYRACEIAKGSGYHH